MFRSETALTLAELGSLLRAEALRRGEAGESDEAWRYSSACRRFEALCRRTCAVDRAALLREVIRLFDGRLAVQAQLLSAVADRDTLALSDILIGERGDGSILLENRALKVAQAPDSEIADCLNLDVRARRHAAEAVGDGVLLRHTQHRAYHSVTQKAALRAIVTMPPGATLIVSIPTGGGKSLLFQLPVLHWRSQDSAGIPVALVIVPTTSLVLSHLSHVRKLAGLAQSAAITASTPRGERQDILGRFRRGEVPLLFVSPEMASAATEDLVALATPVEKRPAWDRGRLAAIFVDEAHIIESWGRSFRPDFQSLGALTRELRARSPELSCVLLSATLSASAKVVLRQLFETEDCLEIAAGVARREFDICVDEFASDEARTDALLASLARLPRPLVIYTTKVEDADELGKAVERLGYRAFAVVTGETSDAERERIVREWIDDSLDLVIATSAFGMGIDKPDVRCVVHACLPEDAARLYQEMGRGGRDGHQATTWLMYCDADAKVAASQAAGGWLRESTAREYWRALRRPSLQAGAITPKNGAIEMMVSLKARPAGVQQGSYTRTWNKALLVLLQRFGALEVKALGESSDEWPIAVKDARLLGDDDWAFAEIYQRREDEVAQAKRAFRRMMEALEERRSVCVLARLYGLVEDADSSVEPCGRCPACRSVEVDPPSNVRWYGVDTNWMNTRREAGLLRVVHPTDDDGGPGATLSGTLQRLGVEQFVVPDATARDWAASLREGTGPGLVVPVSLLLEGWHLACVPTAFVASSLLQSTTEIRDVLELASTFHESTGRYVWVIGGPDLHHRGRPIDQVLSNLAPYSEQHLEDMMTSGRRA
jgi:ATP-dependent DNA helicase RecQ